MLIQFAFFSSYFVFSLPSGKLIDAIGYKKAMVAGLLVMAGRFSVYSSGDGSVFSVFSCGTDSAGGGHDGAAGFGESVRGGAGAGAHSGEPAEFGAGIQFVGHDGRADSAAGC